MRISFALILSFLCSIQLLSARDASGQDMNKVYISLELKDESLVTALERIQQMTPFLFAYNKREIKKIHNLSLVSDNRSVHSIMEALLANTRLRYEQLGNTIVISSVRDRSEGISGMFKQLSPTTSGREEIKARILSGTVTNEKGEPLAGVSITVRGSSVGTSSGADGSFKITVPDEGATLQFSNVGYETQNVKVSATTSTLNIRLKETVSGLNDVVVIGYGTARKSDLTGAVVSLKGESLVDRPISNVSSALEGKIAGVDVNINSNAPGQPAKVRVRGIGSINSNLDPIYVVDGVVGVDINTLNPHEVASIEVLKDASSTAIYGARGANGVIMVTTKRGRKGGDTKVTYEGNVNTVALAKHLKTLNSDQFVQIYNQAYANGAKYDPTGAVQVPPVAMNHLSLPKLFDANDKPLYNTNWEKETYKPATSHDHFIAIQGGNDKSQYSISLGYLNQNGLMVNSWFKRYSMRLTMDNDVNNWLRVGGNLSLMTSTQRLISDANGSLNVPRMVSEEVPIVPIKYPDGSWAGNNDIAGLEGGPNPVHIAQSRYNLNNTLQALGDAYVTIHLTKDLDFKSDFGYNLSAQKNNFYSGQDLPHLSQDQGGEAHINSYYTYYWQTENYLTYTRKINDRQRMTALLGASWQKYSQQWVDAESQNFINDFFQYQSLQAGSVRSQTQSSTTPYQFNSYYARVTYNIDEKYLFTATGRYDGSSKFGVNNKYGFFPSVGAAWRISEEEFMKHSNVISNMKIRASYGAGGNSEVPQYRSLGQVSTGTTVLNGANQSTLLPGYIGNSNLKWEKSLQGDIGLEMGLFRDRVNLTIDGYQRNTHDLILQTPIPWSAGEVTSNVYRNIGSVRNTGLEIGLQTVNVKTHNFTWTTNFIFATNKNEITKLNDGNADIFPGPNFLGETNVLRVGKPIGSFYGMTRVGTWSESEAAEADSHGHLKPGDRKYIYNKDGSPYYSIIGRAYPKWTGTFTSTIAYKQWDFSFDIRFVQGVNTAATFKHSTEDRQTIANSLATVLDGWTPTHQNTMISQVRNYKYAQDSHFDTWWVEDGSFIRGQNITLGYTVADPLARKMHLTRLRLAASVQNFFLSTRYTGYDPEVDTFLTTYGSTTGFSQNLDFFAYPRPRTYNLALTVGF
ncbi:MAG TPA: TonB-dependent receptor [Puia sp.]